MAWFSRRATLSIFSIFPLHLNKWTWVSSKLLCRSIVEPNILRNDGDTSQDAAEDARVEKDCRIFEKKQLEELSARRQKKFLLRTNKGSPVRPTLPENLHSGSSVFLYLFFSKRSRFWSMSLSCNFTIFFGWKAYYMFFQWIEFSTFFLPTGTTLLSISSSKTSFFKWNTDFQGSCAICSSSRSYIYKVRLYRYTFGRVTPCI